MIFDFTEPRQLPHRFQREELGRACHTRASASKALRSKIQVGMDVDDVLESKLVAPVPVKATMYPIGTPRNSVPAPPSAPAMANAGFALRGVLIKCTMFLIKSTTRHNRSLSPAPGLVNAEWRPNDPKCLLMGMHEHGYIPLQLRYRRTTQPCPLPHGHEADWKQTHPTPDS